MTNFEDITLSPSQQNVVDSFPGFLLSKDKEFTISGYAGSGKTFLVQYLTKMAPAQRHNQQGCRSVAWYATPTYRYYSCYLGSQGNE
jgi:ABC-type molybdenum transport system ATPase subunit/photorepair protein PhrA